MRLVSIAIIVAAIISIIMAVSDILESGSSTDECQNAITLGDELTDYVESELLEILASSSRASSVYIDGDVAQALAIVRNSQSNLDEYLSSRDLLNDELAEAQLRCLGDTT